MKTLLAALLLPVSCAGPTPRPELAKGIVASAEPHASEAGAAVLREGGNAVDAAIAVQFALAVTFPNAGNLGGGGFMLVHVASGDMAIDYREMAPLAAHRDLFLDAKGEVVPGRSLDTPLAAGVPGSVAGMWLAHQKFGSLPWRRLLEPAIRLAEEGWILDPWSAASFGREKRHNTRDYFKGAAGSLLVQKELAATLRRIAEHGRDGFYLGETASLIALEMKRSGGLITTEDLAGYEAKIREPVRAAYRGCTIVSLPPPSSGGVALIELLNMAESRGLGALGFHSAAHLHVVAEMEKRVFADRSEFLGDPDFVRIPVDRLTAKDYATERMRTFLPEKRFDPALITHGSATKESEETTHFSIVDRWGNAVSNTTTLNGGYGCGLVVRGAGFLLNNEMDDFSAKPGVPNMGGVTGRQANAIAPRKRMLSSMCPTFLMRDKKLWLVVGTPGGPTIITTVFQVIVNRIDFGMTLSQAVAAPRVHHQWPPFGKDGDPLITERDFPPEVRQTLSGMGYTFLRWSAIGDVQAIEVMDRTGTGVSDPRGIGRVVLE